MKIYNLTDETQLDKVVSFWLPIIQQKKYLLLNGDLGSGKTTFVKYLAKHLGIKEKINSPSFNYMKMYNGLIHIDLYNFKGDIEELEDYFENNIVAIEWSNLHNLKFKEYVMVNAILNHGGSHTYQIEAK